MQYIGLEDFPLEGKVEGLLASASQPPGWQPGSLGRSTYLDLMERILRAAQTWQDGQGAIIDPVLGKE